MDHLQSFIADCDRRTEVAKKRLAETQEEISAEVAAKVSIYNWFLLLCKALQDYLGEILMKRSVLFISKQPFLINSSVLRLK